MSLTFGFYNSVDGDRTYDAIQMSQIFDGIITDGVYATFMKGMVVKASENASEVIVQPGRCWFNHTWTYIDAEYPVEAPAPEVILDRVDALVLDINSENAWRENKLTWVQGEPSSLNPARPTLTNTVTHHQYALAYIYRKAGTTMIYTADITNVIGTSETPFVTGVLKGIDLDAWINQWDDEFHTWENNTKTSFETWMLTQEATYTSWYNAFKDQMEGDLDDFEAWFETIQGIIDSEAATHLQAEIDELREMLPAGSHITIETNETSLRLRDVTVADANSHTKTARFDSSGVAVVDSFPYVGLLTVTSTDGERIATNSLSTPYFGRYTTTLAFWAATVNIVGDNFATVTVKNSEDAFVSSVTLDSTGHGVFTATYPDTYKFSMISGGQTMEVSLAVTQETTYTVEIHAGFNFRAWLTAGRVSGSFNTLDEVLADEETLRQLMLVHDSVDYLAGSSVTTDVEKIFNNDLAAKWINLSDYALDKFYSVSAIKTVMDTADKYGYGEWALMPQVPKMTSATAPYGEVIASSYDTTNNSYPYLAFDNDENTCWTSGYGQAGQWIEFKFMTAKTINAIKTVSINSSAFWPGIVKYQISNDGTNYTDIMNLTVPTIDNYDFIIDTVQNPTPAIYHRIYIQQGGSNPTSRIIYYEIQFYSWAPKGNVPIMTSDTAPYGEAFASSTTSGHPAYYVFDNNYSTTWTSSNTAQYNASVGYKFANPICAKMISYIPGAAGTASVIFECEVQASNDNFTTYDVVGTFSYNQQNQGTQYFVNLNNNNYYLSYRVKGVSETPSEGIRIEFVALQFYGRELSVSVPKMDTNTTPYGEASFGYTGTATTGVSFPAYYAFDGDDSTGWRYEVSGNRNTTINQWIQYEFPSPIVIKQAKIIWGNAFGNPIKLQKYVDSEYNDCASYTPTTTGDPYTYMMDIDDDTPSTKYRFFFEKPGYEYNARSGCGVSVYTIQFYGLDYSEKEFEEGTNKKWLYDHGLELEPIVNGKDDGWSLSSGYSWGEDIVKQSSDIVITNTGSSKSTIVSTHNAIDMTPYNSLGIIASTPYLHTLSAGVGVYTSKSQTAYIAAANLLVGNTKSVLGISSITQNCYVAVDGANGQRDCLVKELWLE